MAPSEQGSSAPAAAATSNVAPAFGFGSFFTPAAPQTPAVAGTEVSIVIPF